MCRILLAIGAGKELERLALAMRSASFRDPYRAFRGRRWSHGDGWGYLLVTHDELQHYRSLKPVYTDDRGFETLMESIPDRGLLIMHSRVASQGGINLRNTQPFSFSTGTGLAMWLVHNGDLEGERLKAKLEASELTEGVSDSYLLGLYLRDNLKSPSVEALVTLLGPIKGAVRTSLNTIFATINEEIVRAFAVAYSNPEYAGDVQNWEYARLLYFKNQSLITVASSTVGLYYEAPWKTLTNGTVMGIELRGHDLEVGGVRSMTMAPE